MYNTPTMSSEVSERKVSVMGRKVSQIFWISCILILISTQQVHATVCFPYGFFSSPEIIIGSVYDVDVERKEATFSIKNIRTISFSVPPKEFEDDDVIPLPRPVDISTDWVKDYIQNNNGEIFLGSSVLSRRLYRLPSHMRPENDDIIIKGEGYAALFTEKGVLKKEHSYHRRPGGGMSTRVFRNTDINFEFKNCTGINKILPLYKLLKKCEKAVEFTLNDHSITLSPGQSFHFDNEEVRAIHLLEADTHWGNDRCWKKTESISYILDSSEHYSQQDDLPGNNFIKALRLLRQHLVSPP